MNTKDLLYFQKLVETRNYTKTAQAFHLSQPSITAAVKRLSAEFDVDLILQKSPRGRFTVTPAGHILYDRANEILGLLKVTANEVKDANEPKLRLGVSPVVGRAYLADILEELNDDGLERKIDIREAGSTELVYQLEDGKVDVTLVNLFSPVNNNVTNSKILRKNSIKLIVSQNNPLASKSEIDFSKLGQNKFITMGHRFVHRQIFDRYCQNAKLHPKIAYTTDNISILLELVKKNLGIALVTELAGAGKEGIKALNVVGVPAITTYTLLQTRADIRLTPVQKKMIAVIEKRI